MKTVSVILFSLTLTIATLAARQNRFSSAEWCSDQELEPETTSRLVDNRNSSHRFVRKRTQRYGTDREELLRHTLAQEKKEKPRVTIFCRVPAYANRAYQARRGGRFMSGRRNISTQTLQRDVIEMVRPGATAFVPRSEFYESTFGQTAFLRREPYIREAELPYLPPGRVDPLSDLYDSRYSKGARSVPVRIKTGEVATLATADIMEFSQQPYGVRTMISYALGLTGMGLGYKYGSSDPEQGGMDCSGTIYHILTHLGYLSIPRDSLGLYHWVKQQGNFTLLQGEGHGSFKEIKPGDLLFWINTYETKRNPPISHVSMYIGTDRNTGLPVMVGASEGRKYKSRVRNGVSVFEFHYPESIGISGGKSNFIGYGSVPGIPQHK